MAFDFDRLSREAQRAAFANMSKSGKVKRATKSLGSGDRRAGMPTGRDSKPAAEDRNAILARNYVAMHGTDGARKKIAQLQARKRLTAKDKAQVAALKAAISK